MEHYMALIVYNGKDKPFFRKDWKLTNVSAEEFDITKHQGCIFMHPERDILKGDLMDVEGMYIWQWCIPECNEEEAKLIEMGKWDTLKAGTYGLHDK